MTKRGKLSVGQVIVGILVGFICLAILGFAGYGIYSTVKCVQDKSATEQTEQTPEEAPTTTTVLQNYVKQIDKI